MFQNNRYHTIILRLGLLFIVIARITLAKPVASLSNAPSRDENLGSTSLIAGVNDTSLLLARAGNYGVLPLLESDPDWDLDFYAFDWGYLPVSTASFLLQTFYLHVIEIATRTTEPAPRHSMIRWGQLELEIIVSNGSIGWASVAHFARHMLQSTKRGFTNSYHCHMSNIPAGMWVTFNLYVHAVQRLPIPRA